MRRFLSLLPVLLLVLPAAAQQTKLLVRAVSHDAKIIGSNVGGARIVVQDAKTGAVLAEGVQEGSTGDTDRILGAHDRDATVYDTEGAAGFLATLALERPTLVDVTAYGPLNTPDALRRASKRLLLVPGQDVLGEGLNLDLNGFTVELLAAPSSGAAGEALAVTAKVTMLCGCPTEPGGLWDADDISIVARLLQNGKIVAEGPLVFTGETSTFRGELVPPASGAYSLEVLAMEPATANFGQATHTVVVE